MAYQVQQFTATIPAGTTLPTLHTVSISFDNWTIEQIDLEVPPGPAGLMGFYVANNGVQWVPAGAGQFLVWDDVQNSWPLSDQPNASGWAVVGYNGGVYDHAVIVRMHVNPTTPLPAVNTPPAVTFVTSPPPPGDLVTL